MIENSMANDALWEPQYRKVEAKSKEYYSNCCGAFLDPWFEDTEICPECGEHCGLIEEGDL